MRKGAAFMVLWKWNPDHEYWESTQLELEQSIYLSSLASLHLLQPGHCVLLARHGVTVNGTACLPFRLLADRDEIRVEDRTFYVGQDPDPPKVEFTTEHEKLRCGRCQGSLEVGDTGVACPACGAFHHHTQEQPCWSYGASCSGCDHRTSGPTWHPEHNGG